MSYVQTMGQPKRRMVILLIGTALLAQACSNGPSSHSTPGSSLNQNKLFACQSTLRQMQSEVRKLENQNRMCIANSSSRGLSLSSENEALGKELKSLKKNHQALTNEKSKLENLLRELDKNVEQNSLLLNSIPALNKMAHEEESYLKKLKEAEKRRGNTIGMIFGSVFGDPDVQTMLKWEPEYLGKKINSSKEKLKLIYYATKLRAAEQLNFRGLL